MTRSPRTITMTMTMMLGLALVVSGCAAGDVGGNEAASPATSTTTATTSTTAPQPATTPLTADTIVETTTSTPAREGSSELATLIARMADAPVVSGRIEGSTEIVGLDVGTGVTDASIAFATAFDAASGDASFLIDFSAFAAALDTPDAGAEDPFAGFAESFAAPMEFRQVGDRVYVRTPLFTEMFGIGTEWLSMPAEDGQDVASGFEMVPSDPSAVLDVYDGADASVADLGSATINGVEVTHYLVTFDTAAMVARMSPEERAEVDASGVFADGTVPLDLWVTAEGHVARMILDIDGSMAEGPAGEGFARLRVRYDAYDIGGDVRIEAPRASTVTEIESLDLGDMTFDVGS